MNHHLMTYAAMLEAIEAGRVMWAPQGRGFTYRFAYRDRVTKQVKPLTENGIARRGNGRCVELSDQGRKVLGRCRRLGPNLSASGYVMVGASTHHVAGLLDSEVDALA